MTDETLLLRQVNPSWIQAGRVTSQAFKPTPKDDDQLSVYDGDQVTPEESWEHYTTDLGFLSVGAVAVSVAECVEEGLTARPEPAPFPAHTVIDYRDCTSNGQRERKAKKLRTRAMTRGWLHQVDSDS